MKKYYCILFFLIYYGCDESLPPLSVNAYDPSSKYFIGNPATNLTFESLGRNSVKLIWKDNSSFEKGFFLEKANLNTLKTEHIYSGPDITSITLDSLDIYDSYKFRIAAKTNSDFFRFSDSITIMYDPYVISSQVNGGYHVQISGNSKRCIQESGDNKLNIYDIKNGSLVLLRQISWYNSGYKLSDDGNIIVFGAGSIMGYYDIENDRKVILRQSSLLDTWGADISRDNKYLLTRTSDNIAELWDIQQQLPRTFKLPASSKIFELKISPDSRFIMSRDASYIYLWNLNTFDLYYKFPCSGAYNSCFSDDCKSLLYYDPASKLICSLDLVSKKLNYMISDDGYVTIRLIRGGDFLSLFKIIYNGEQNNYYEHVLWPIKSNTPGKPLVFLSNKFKYSYYGASIAENGDVFISRSHENPAILKKFMDIWKKTD